MKTLGEDRQLTFQQLRDINLKRAREYYAHFTTCDDWSVNDWYTALVGEVGELGNVLKKFRRGDYNATQIHEVRMIAEEIADIQIYLDLLAYKCGVNLALATIAKFNIVSDRVGSKVKL